MNGKPLVILVLAVAIGLGAMLLSRQLLSSGKGKQEEETQEIVVAARDFKDEEPLKPDMVKVVRMAKSAVPAGSFSSFKDLEDRWVKSTLLEGDVLVEKKLGPKGTPPGLVANIPKGMRAFAIDVTEQSGVSGFILPGHHVDVVQHHNGDKNESRVDTILQNVLVLAAGQIFTRPDEKSLQSRTVTLALKPDDVQVLVAARALGALSLALRGVNDHDVIARQPPKPTIDPEHEKRLKQEEEKRAKLEEELRNIKETLAKEAMAREALAKEALAKEALAREALAREALAKKTAQTLVAKRSPRITTIYRGIQNRERVRTDQPAVAELEPPEPPAFPEGTASRAEGDARAAQVASAGSQREP
jgi:pilus assembly protein CpaB